MPDTRPEAEQAKTQEAPYDFTDEKQVAEWSKIKDRKPFQPTVAFIGMAAEHDMPCPIRPHLFATYHCQTGVFHPSWGAHEEGWRLVRARNWFQRLLIHLFFARDPIRDDHIVRS